LFAAMARSDAGRVREEIGYVDPLDIKDPNGVARRRSKDGVPLRHYRGRGRGRRPAHRGRRRQQPAYSTGRKPNVQDGNEFILLRVPKLLRARWRSKRRNPLDNLDRPRDHYCSQSSGKRAVRDDGPASASAS